MGTEHLLIVGLYIALLGQAEKDSPSLPPLQDSAGWLELYQRACDYFEAKWRATEIPPKLLEKYAQASPIGIVPRIQILVDLHLGSIEEAHTKEAALRQ